MSNTETAPEQPQADAASAHRRLSAQRWASAMAGCGFARIGRTGGAVVGQALMLALAGSIVAFAITFNPAAVWGIAASAGALVLFWLVELAAVNRSRPGKQGASGWLLATLALGQYALLFGSAGVLMMSAGTIVVDNGRMRPTLLPGDKLIYSTRVAGEELAAGQVVVILRPAGPDGQAEAASIVRVLAVPGDTVGISEGGQYVVNGKEAGAAKHGRGEFARPTPEAPMTIRPGHVFVTQDSSQGADSLTGLGLVAFEKVIGVRPMPLPDWLPVGAGR